MKIIIFDNGKVLLFSERPIPSGEHDLMSKTIENWVHGSANILALAFEDESIIEFRKWPIRTNGNSR